MSNLIAPQALSALAVCTIAREGDSLRSTEKKRDMSRNILFCFLRPTYAALGKPYQTPFFLMIMDDSSEIMSDLNIFSRHK